MSNYYVYNDYYDAWLCRDGKFRTGIVLFGDSRFARKCFRSKAWASKKRFVNGHPNFVIEIPAKHSLDAAGYIFDETDNRVSTVREEVAKLKNVLDKSA